jgi:H+/Cl- antiporter ClcA
MAGRFGARQVRGERRIILGGSGGLEAPGVYLGETVAAGWSKVFKRPLADELRLYQLTGIAAIGTLLAAPSTAVLLAVGFLGGALHYILGMHGFYISIPFILWLFGPVWMLLGSIGLVFVLRKVD